MNEEELSDDALGAVAGGQAIDTGKQPPVCAQFGGYGSKDPIAR